MWQESPCRYCDDQFDICNQSLEKTPLFLVAPSSEAGGHPVLSLSLQCWSSGTCPPLEMLQWVTCGLPGCHGHGKGFSPTRSPGQLCPSVPPPRCTSNTIWAAKLELPSSLPGSSPSPHRPDGGSAVGNTPGWTSIKHPKYFLHSHKVEKLLFGKEIEVFFPSALFLQ